MGRVSGQPAKQPAIMKDWKKSFAALQNKEWKTLCNQIVRKQEEEVRESRRQKQPCPFAAAKAGKKVCTHLHIRCGDRTQFSLSTESESETMKRKPHICRRRDYAKDRQARVMVVEDDPDVRSLYVQYLELIGITDCVEASDGRSAQQLLEEQKRKSSSIDLVVSDIEMGPPENSGKALLGYMRRRNFLCPVILASGSENINDSVATHPAEVRRIRKPFQMREMETMVTELIG